MAKDVTTEIYLKKERIAVTFTYVVIVYLIFLVFTMTGAGMAATFFPKLPTEIPETGAGRPMGLGGGTVDPRLFTLFFFHAILIQGFCMGLLAGKFRTGNPLDGLKHSIIMCFLGWLTFAVLVT